MSDESDQNVIVVTDLEKTYASGAEQLTIIKSLNMRVPCGTKAVIVGESGSGKSTLLNIIGGLDLPTSGTVRVGPYRVSSLGEDELAAYRSKFVGLIFQFHYLLKDFTALENVFLPAYMSGVPKKAAEEKARQLLCDVGLEHRLTHLPSQLSGGERQRVAVARSLVQDPELVLADEPTGNLDPANAAAIGELLFSLTDRYKKTLVLVTHDRELARGGDILYTISAGKLAEVSALSGNSAV
ncbi:ABC transporter ATP-binding protein [Treponema brennaborense]|uniref:Phosphonate-transporting ATPase n=1 Tax=Treponema brennaborense (strain DSM 12168 / CIP 105900 / DD5/3) TaxID=906968 RepID=F4LJV0_TREBD|nr:ABC transporter ATP-binding protein [Treponema brennaborense]AEE16430.1 Phosphonate-transporting ATPase [Treponema brennaborense DSM 12168]